MRESLEEDRGIVAEKMLGRGLTSTEAQIVKPRSQCGDRLNGRQVQLGHIYGVVQAAFLDILTPDVLILTLCHGFTARPIRDFTRAQVSTYSTRRLCHRCGTSVALGEHMRILITGGAGFIGSHLADHLLEHGYDV